MILRDYQEQAVIDIRSLIARGSKSPLYVLPTGGGKSAIICKIIQAAVDRGSEVFFIAPRRQLVYQISEDLHTMSVRHGVMMSGINYSFTPQVMVSSLDTLFSRLASVFKKPKLIIIDESHTVLGKKIKAILDKYPGVMVIGFTATPARSDGRGLGELYDDIIIGPSMKELIERGYLVPCRYFTTPGKIDLEGIQITAGDYNQKQLDKRMNTDVLIGDIIDNWKRLASDRRTVVFAVKRTHAMSIQERFNEAGVVCDYIDGNTPNDERKKILKRIESGESQVLSSVDVLSYGWNSPAVSCGIVARPTKSIARYLQMIGRIVRSYPGKEYAIVLDHANVVSELGFVDDDQPWTLDSKVKIQELKESNNPEKAEPDSMVCPHCKRVQKPSPRCINCDADLGKKYAEEIEEFKADLAEIDRKTKEKKKREWTHEDKQMFFSELIHVAHEKNYQKGWVSHKYKERVGVWPKGLNEVSATPSNETRRWLKSKLIAYVKAKEKASKEKAA